METSLIMYSIGGIPLFASRVFITAFVAAVMARVNPGLFTHFPAWVAADSTLFVLGLLALVENRATKSPALGELMAEFDPYVKSLASFFFSQLVLAHGQLEVASSLAVHAGFGLVTFVALIPAAGTWLVASLRNRVFGELVDLDEDDDLGVRRLLSWAEDGWVAFGMVFLVLLPAVALTIVGLSVLTLYLVRKYLEVREERSKTPCPSCGSPNYQHAVACFECRSEFTHPKQVGSFGQALSQVAGNREEHQLRLLGRRRCCICAARLPSRTVQQQCPACGTCIFGSKAWADRYLSYLQGKLSHTIAICFIFSLVPLLGLIPGIIYYRLSLISSLRIYIPIGTGCVTRWMVRVVNLILLAFQWIPGLGAITLPAMCYLNYSIYRRVLERENSVRVPAYPPMSPLPGTAHAVGS
ncbi:MAG: hypothetical protein HC897_07850 [Thermoanaerobaculia bacterium]|nr:hypothetical protein [Thermoanaerobaculia bacterium]